MPDDQQTREPAAGRAGPIDADQRQLAERHRDVTTVAITAARAAHEQGTAAAHLDASRAALAAGRNAAALRHAALAQQLAPDDRDIEQATRAASQALVKTRAAWGKAGALFARVLADKLRELTAHPSIAEALLQPVATDSMEGVAGAVPVAVRREADSVCLLDVVNAALAGLGDTGVRVDGVSPPRTVLLRADRPPTPATIAASLPDDGAPCEVCGAPRWSFERDEEHGPFCGFCGFPFQHMDLTEHRRRARVRDLESQLAESQVALATAQAETKAARSDLDAARGTIGKLRGTADRLLRLGRGRGRSIEPPRASSAGDMAELARLGPDATIEDMAAAGKLAVASLQQSLAHAEASLATVNELAVQARQRAAAENQ